jgi:hypothetical protein
VDEEWGQRWPLGISCTSTGQIKVSTCNRYPNVHLSDDVTDRVMPQTSHSLPFVVRDVKLTQVSLVT